MTSTIHDKAKRLYSLFRETAARGIIAKDLKHKKVLKNDFIHVACSRSRKNTSFLFFSYASMMIFRRFSVLSYVNARGFFWTQVLSEVQLLCLQIADDYGQVTLSDCLFEKLYLFKFQIYSDRMLIPVAADDMSFSFSTYRY